MTDDPIDWNIHVAGNTFNPCLIILRQKGWTLRAETDGDRLIWSALRNGVECSAFSPPELLGIVTLAETFGRDWNRQEPDIFGEILRRTDGE